MTTRPNRLLQFLIALPLAAAFLITAGSKPALAQEDPCAVPVALPDGSLNFAFNNLSGIDPPTPNIQLQAARYGNASFMEVSNSPDFPGPDPVLGKLTEFFPLSGEGNDIFTWTLSPGYDKVKLVYVRYVNSCKAMPTATIIGQTAYWPDICDLAVTPPAGGFKVQLVGSSPVASANIQLTFAGGSSVYAEVSNNADFSSSQTIYIGYGSISPFPWTLPGYGNWTVYARFLNDCEALPTPAVSVAVSYPDPNVTCGPINQPYWQLMITSQGPTNVKLGQPVTLIPHGNNATWVQISNSNTFSNSSWYKIAENPTIVWRLPYGIGSKTVWAKFYDGCKANPAPQWGTSLSFAVSR
jgi:hypothetical protein